MLLEKNKNMQIEQYSRTQLIIRKLFHYAIRLQVLLIIVTVGLYLYPLHSRYELLCSQEEPVRITAPDGNTDAVLIDKHCYLKGGNVRAIFLVPVNEPISDNAIAVERDISMVNSKWLPSNKFLLTYEKGNLRYELAIEVED